MNDVRCDLESEVMGRSLGDSTLRPRVSTSEMIGGDMRGRLAEVFVVVCMISRLQAKVMCMYRSLRCNAPGGVVVAFVC